MPASAVIVDAIRTPVGKSSESHGLYRQTRSEDLVVACLRKLVERCELDPHSIDDIYLGCTQQLREQGLNIARMAALLAGFPPTVPGATINRLCGSSLEAIRIAAQQIELGEAEAILAGGVEHMQHLPMESTVDLHPELARYTSRASVRMGMTAEFLAERFSITRAQQDAFALESHHRAARAAEQGCFAREMVPISGLDTSGQPVLATRDQPTREDTSLEQLAALPAAFCRHGSVTAGNSSPLSDGAAITLVMHEAAAKARGLQPLARIVGSAVAGLEPSLMGLGPVVASRKLLAKQKLDVAEIDRWELSEAFAVQTLACIDQLGLAPQRVNLSGGGLSIGHPLGASGARMMATLVHGMVRDQVELGVAAMCIGMGQGIAILVENIT